MLNIFEAGDETYRLADARDRDVGWVRGNAIGFDGLSTEASAIEAAVAGSASLASYLERINGVVRPEAAADGPVRTAQDGAYEWIVRGKRQLARLYRPERERPRSDRRRTFAVEFVLPSYVKPGTAIGAAQVLYPTIAVTADATGSIAGSTRPTTHGSKEEAQGAR